MEENSIRRIPPHSDKAERAVIGAILMDRNVMSDVIDILAKEDFYNAQIGILYETMVELYNEGKPIDVVMLSERLKAKKDVPEELGSVSFIAGIINDVPTSVHAEQYAKLVKDNAILRRMIRISDDISKDCYLASDDVDNILERAEDSVFRLVQSRNGSEDFVPMKKIMVDVIGEIEAASRNKGRINGLATGFLDLDYMLTGLHPGELVLVAARPSMGKTAFVLNIAHHVAIKQNIPVVMFSLEMSKEQLASRMLAMDAMVDSQVLKTGELNDNDWDKVIESTDITAQAPIYIDDNSSITIAELRSKCRKLAMKEDIGLIIIDYLQLMNPSHPVESRQQFISEISRALKALARELKVPVIALSQLNRAADTRPDHKPVLADLRESGAIEQDADVVMFIYRDEYYNKETEKPGVAEIIVAKQRNGSTGSVDLIWLGKYTKFSNMAK